MKKCYPYSCLTMCVSKSVPTAHYSRFNFAKGVFSRIIRSDQQEHILKPNSQNPKTIFHGKVSDRNLCCILSIL